MYDIIKDSVQIMGVLNVTPDSFYTNSRMENMHFSSNFFKFSNIIDVGCESTRPYSVKIDSKMEVERLKKFINTVELKNAFLSIDTYKPEVAKIALQNGFSMINDIKSGGIDNAMLYLAAEFDCPIVLMHMKGNPSNMQDNPFYDDVLDDIVSFFEEKIKIAEKIGLNKNNIILDPGIGFGKCIADNDKIIVNLKKIKQFNLPILIGLSRKSFLTINDDDPECRLPSTLAATVLAIENGANILRVHDVLETYKVIETLKRIKNNNSDN